MTYLDLLGQSPEEHVCPTLSGPMRQHRSSNARIHQYESFVSLVIIFCLKYLRVCTHIITGVVSLDNSNIGLVWNQVFRGGFSIQDEHKVGGRV